MSTSGGHPSSKTLTVGSQTGSISASGRGGASFRRRRARVPNEKKIADDEFMAAAIGDVEWLKQSLRENGSQINYDKNVSTKFPRGNRPPPPPPPPFFLETNK